MAKARRSDLDATSLAPEFSAYRGRVFYSLAVAAALVLLPFSINNFIQGRIWLGLATSVVVVGFFTNALAVHQRRPLPIPPAVLFLPVVGALLMSVRYQQIVGVLWTFPALVLFHFVLERRWANAFNIGLLVLVTPLAYPFAGLRLTVRIFATLALTILFTNIFSAIVGGLQRRLHELAIRDPLTGAFNRRHLAHCLEEARERYGRSGAGAALVSLDIDHFKRLNDECGHGEGDRVLCRVVEALRDRMRRLDLLFRSGGEEFLLLLSDTDSAGALALAEELRAAIEVGDFLPDRTVTASFGTAALVPGETAESWLRRSDHALYAAKAAGRNRVQLAEAVG